MYQSYDNIFTRNKYINWLAIKLINFGEFHAKTHHDTDINKSFKNIISNNIFEEKVASQMSLGGGLVSSNYRAY
jgi:hypothetical protein